MARSIKRIERDTFEETPLPALEEVLEEGTAAGIDGTYPPRRRPFSMTRALFFIAILAIIGVGIFYVYRSYTSPEAKQARIDKEIKQLVARVGTHMILPQNEQPIVYDIADPATLVVTQPFFNGAEKGDKLVIFPQSARAIVYSPERDLIVNVGPINFDQPGTAAPAPKQ